MNEKSREEKKVQDFTYCWMKKMIAEVSMYNYIQL